MIYYKMSSLSSNCLLNVKTETLSDFNSNLDEIKKLKQEIEKLKAKNEKLYAEKQELIDTAVAFINVNDVKEFIYENYQKKYDDDFGLIGLKGRSWEVRS